MAQMTPYTMTKAIIKLSQCHNGMPLALLFRVQVGAKCFHGSEEVLELASGQA